MMLLALALRVGLDVGPHVCRLLCRLPSQSMSYGRAGNPAE